MLWRSSGWRVLHHYQQSPLSNNTFRQKALYANLDTYQKGYNSPSRKMIDGNLSTFFFFFFSLSRVQAIHTLMNKEQSISVIFIFQYTDPSPIAAAFSLFLDQKAHPNSGPEPAHTLSISVHAPCVSGEQRCSLASCLKPEAISSESSLQDSNASVTFCMSNSIFGARRLIFFLPTSESPECVPPSRPPLPRGTDNTTTRINLKNWSRGSLPTKLGASHEVKCSPCQWRPAPANPSSHNSCSLNLCNPSCPLHRKSAQGGMWNGGLKNRILV